MGRDVFRWNIRFKADSRKETQKKRAEVVYPALPISILCISTDHKSAQFCVKFLGDFEPFGVVERA